jgi:hypothetical protein
MPTTPPVEVESFGSRALSQLQAIAARSAGGAAGAAGRSGAAAADSQRTLIDRVERLITRVGMVAGGVVAGGAATAGALARRGFGGTVEGARLDYAMEQLSRQLAAVFQPVIQGMTYAATRIDRAFRNLDGTGQNRVLGGVLGAGAGLALGGPLGAMAGGLIGSRLGGGDVDAALGGLAGVGGWKAARALGVGRLGAAGLAGAAAAPFLLAHEGRDAESRIRRDVADDLGMSETSRTVRLLTWAGKVGSGIRNTVGDITGREVPGEGLLAGMVGKGAAKAGVGGGDARRDVTLFQTDQTAAGQAYFEIQKAVLRTTAGGGDDGGPLKPVIDIGLEIIRLLGIVAGVDVKYTDPEDSIRGSHVAAAPAPAGGIGRR